MGSRGGKVSSSMSVPDVPSYLPEEGGPPDLRSGLLLRDVAYLVRDLAADPRVPWRAKAVAAAAIVYVTPGVRRWVPRPPVALVVEPLVVMAGMRYLVAAAGYEVVRETWQGDDAGFVWLLVITGIDA